MHPFVASLGFEQDADIDAVERRFLEIIKERLQKVSTNFDEAEVKKEETWLREIHIHYFRYVMQWVMDEARNNKTQTSAEAIKLKKQAREVMDGLQRHMIEFVCCYMHLNRFMTLLRDEIRSEEARLGAGNSRDTKWTSDAGAMIGRYKTQKRILLGHMDRMKSARPILELLESTFDDFRHCIGYLYGGDKVDTLQRPVIAALRTKDFRRARKALTEIAEGKKKFSIDQKSIDDSVSRLLAAGKKIIDTCESNEEILVSDENRLYLKPGETDQAYNSQIRELRKIKGFLAKYYMPYMQYKLDMLMHLKDKLLVNGSVESQMTLYKRLMAGIARPLADIKELRTYESEVLEKIKYLLAGQFQEVPVILTRARETVNEFRQGADDFLDIEKLEISEIDLSDDDKVAAQ